MLKLKKNGSFIGDSFIFAQNLKIENVGDFISTSKTWNPNMSNESREDLLTSWFKAIERSKHWL